MRLPWVKESEPVVVAGPKNNYRWTRTEEPTTVRVIRQIDQQAMKEDIFNTMKGKKQGLVGTSADWMRVKTIETSGKGHSWAKQPTLIDPW